MLVFIRQLLLTVFKLHRLRRSNADLARSIVSNRCSGPDSLLWVNVEIVLQELLNGYLVHQVQVDMPRAEPVTESGNGIHLHRNRRGQKARLLNPF